MQTVKGLHCCVLQEGTWIYEAEPDWVINLTRWAPWLQPLSLLALFCSRMPRCMHWARVMLGSREFVAGLLRLVNALTGVGIERPPFSDKKKTRSGAK